MFNLGFPELIVIAGAALLVFGPRRLPELAKSLGKGIRDFKKALEEPDKDDQAAVPPPQKLPNNLNEPTPQA